ncbi:MAG: type II toxin-antitoxin system HicA family toxin [Myxococcales bacterium]|nr:type II toxin-antitoxin system HicA family toxin [Myxococcales bacterium]
MRNIFYCFEISLIALISMNAYSQDMNVDSDPMQQMNMHSLEIESLSDAVEIWKSANFSEYAKEFLPVLEDIYEGLDYLKNLGERNKLITPKKKLMQIIKIKHDVMQFLKASFCYLQACIEQHINEQEFLMMSKQKTQAILNNLNEYKAWLKLNRGAVALFKNISIIKNDLSNQPIVISDRELAFSLIILQTDGLVLTSLGKINDNICSMPFFYANDLGFQSHVIFSFEKCLSSFGFHVKNKNQIPSISLYSGAFSSNPFSLSRLSLTMARNKDENFQEFCKNYCQNLYSDSAGFIPLFENEEEKHGFLAEFYNYLLEKFKLTGFIRDSDVTYEDRIMLPDFNTQSKEDYQHAEAVQEQECNSKQEEETFLQYRTTQILEIRKSVRKKRDDLFNQQIKNKHSAKKKYKKKRQKKTGQDNENQLRFKQEIENEEKTFLDRVNKGRIKFRKVKTLIGRLLKEEKILLESTQNGSHIQLTNFSTKEKICVVKLHGKKNSLAPKQVEQILQSIVNK